MDIDTPLTCIHCGQPTEHLVGEVSICEACYPLAGACCAALDDTHLEEEEAE